MMSQCCTAILFFFFQAEVGIRDYKVTGVQTCALPIWRRCTLIPSFRSSPSSFPKSANSRARNARSEERRVGKECRSRWSPCHYKKKNGRIYMALEGFLDRLLTPHDRSLQWSRRHRVVVLAISAFFFKQKTAYEITR